MNFFSGQACSLSAALEQIGLADIMQIVRLMSLCAAGKMELLYQSLRNDESSKHLKHLTTAIGALIEENPAALKQLIQLCTQVMCCKLVQNFLFFLFPLQDGVILFFLSGIVFL